MIPAFYRNTRIESMARHFRSFEPQAQITVPDASPRDGTCQTERQLPVDAVISETGRVPPLAAKSMFHAPALITD